MIKIFETDILIIYIYLGKSVAKNEEAGVLFKKHIIYYKNIK